MTENSKRSFSPKIKDALLICVLVVALLVCAWGVFSTESKPTDEVFSDTERRVDRLIEEIEGVGEAEVMICQTENGVKSVVVVCEGGNDLQVIVRVREAVAAALGTEEKAVKIYVKKE